MTFEDSFRRMATKAELPVADVCFGSAAQSQSFQFTAESVDLPIASHRRYLIASITKPIVAMAALRLASEGVFCLSDRLRDFLPAFQAAAYRRISLRSLLTHTSGFPDMLPENAELRTAHASLSDFSTKAATTPLSFPTGTDCRYSSIGFLLLGRIIEHVTSMPLRSFLSDEFFRPLQMNESWLGIPEDCAEEILPTVQPSLLPVWQPDADDWGWNSRYWRTLGAPWGGMISTSDDLGKFAAMMLNEGNSAAGRRVLPSEIIREAMRDQLFPIATQPEYQGPQRPWGFGWRRQWPAHAASFGDFVSDQTVGHWGATGTMMYIDPVSRRFCVVLTTTPYEQSQSFIQRLSNIVATQPSPS